MGKGSTRVYPYDPKTKIRCSCDYEKYAKEAVKTNKVSIHFPDCVKHEVYHNWNNHFLQVVCGVKGRSVLQLTLTLSRVFQLIICAAG